MRIEKVEGGTLVFWEDDDVTPLNFIPEGTDEKADWFIKGLEQAIAMLVT